MKKKNILVLTYWSIDNALIHTYTLPYIFQIKSQLDPGSVIYLLTLSNKGASSKPGTKELRSELRSKNIRIINFNYQPFSSLMLLKLGFIIIYLAVLVIARKIGTLHGWCTPGGAFGYLLSKITGRPLILDSFEPHALPMIESGTWKKGGMPFRILFWLEKKQLRRATEVICATPGMIPYSVDVYGVRKNRYFVKPASVDLDHFTRHKKKNPELVEELGLANKIVCVYAGKFGGLYLEQEVFDFFAECYNFWGDRFRVILLTATPANTLNTYISNTNLPATAVTTLFVDPDKVVDYIGLGDFGICPIKPVKTRKYSTPIKNGEYWAMGLPIVITRYISVDSDIVDENNIGYVLKELTGSEYRKAVEKINELIHTEGISEKIRAIAEQERNFSNSLQIYKTIYA